MAMQALRVRTKVDTGFKVNLEFSFNCVRSDSYIYLGTESRSQLFLGRHFCRFFFRLFGAIYLRARQINRIDTGNDLSTRDNSPMIWLADDIRLRLYGFETKKSEVAITCCCCRYRWTFAQCCDASCGDTLCLFSYALVYVTMPIVSSHSNCYYYCLSFLAILFSSNPLWTWTLDSECLLSFRDLLAIYT